VCGRVYGYMQCGRAIHCLGHHMGYPAWGMARWSSVDASQLGAQSCRVHVSQQPATVGPYEAGQLRAAESNKPSGKQVANSNSCPGLKGGIDTAGCAVSLNDQTRPLLQQASRMSVPASGYSTQIAACRVQGLMGKRDSDSCTGVSVPKRGYPGSAIRMLHNQLQQQAHSNIHSIAPGWQTASGSWLLSAQRPSSPQQHTVLQGTGLNPSNSLHVARTHQSLTLCPLATRGDGVALGLPHARPHAYLSVDMDAMGWYNLNLTFFLSCFFSPPQLRHQEEGRAGACGQGQPINRHICASSGGVSVSFHVPCAAPTQPPTIQVVSPGDQGSQS
jgi:hypothetical protein